VPGVSALINGGCIRSGIHGLSSFVSGNSKRV
jgi:hypothetical protein